METFKLKYLLYDQCRLYQLPTNAATLATLRAFLWPHASPFIHLLYVLIKTWSYKAVIYDLFSLLPPQPPHYVQWNYSCISNTQSPSNLITVSFFITPFSFPQVSSPKCNWICPIKVSLICSSDLQRYDPHMDFGNKYTSCFEFSTCSHFSRACGALGMPFDSIKLITFKNDFLKFSWNREAITTWCTFAHIDLNIVGIWMVSSTPWE